MSSILLDKFIESEPGAIPGLLKALVNNDGKSERELNFNLFDIFINFETGLVEIIDICQLFGVSGATQVLPIDFVLSTLRKSSST